MSKWEMVRLGDVCDVRDGTHDSPEYVTNGYPLVTSKNVTNGYIDITDVNYISKDDYNKIIVRSGVDNGDIIMPMIGTIGNPVVVHKTFDFAIKNVALIKFIGDNVLNRYIFYILTSSIFKRYIESENRGGTQKFISLGNIRNFSVPLPPLKTQKQIAKNLDTAAELLAMRKQQLTELDNLIKSTFYDMFGDTESNGKDWDMFSFSSIFVEFKYGTSVKSSYKQLGHPILRIPNVVGGTINLDDLQYNNTPDGEYQRIKLIENDLLFVRSNGNPENIGRSALVRKEHEGFVYASYLIRARIDSNKVNFNSIYLSELFKTDAMRKQMKDKSKTTAGQYNINTRGLGSLKIFLPTLSLQTQFAAIVTKIEEQKTLVKKAIDETQYLFDSLMSEYFE